ncbi:hypothetical protein [Saccharopolyspora spinosa]|uniref:Uncharacterized protein n=1 Tax=Saccharopolyspora spinosa TaxID=60894 RepID=A0A2N3Y1L6_SACSN|nr:hypothetical protein [Saccharopolyspora spinosa]PKW16799.1 hypothetical protein A8926_4687 [Saccharopolyspora spinosa]
MTGGEIAALLALGAFHGLNPAMGWLFAVALGLQERSRTKLLRVLPAIATGHAAAVAIVAMAVGISGSVLTGRVVGIVGGLLLVGFGLWRLLSRRHFRWVGMCLTGWQLAAWSFLMSSAHGAGLMLLPVLVERPAPATHQHHHMPATTVGSGGLADAVLHASVATVVHTVAMVVTAGVVAVVVFEFLGLRILRIAWINLDRVWAIALLGAGVAVLFTS